MSATAFASFEQAQAFFQSRREETQTVIEMMRERMLAEMEYA